MLRNVQFRYNYPNPNSVYFLIQGKLSFGIVTYFLKHIYIPLYPTIYSLPIPFVFREFYQEGIPGILLKE